MKSVLENKPSHIVKGDILDELGFSASEASALKVKAGILSAILDCVRKRGYSQAELVDILDEHQPSVSNLLRGRITQVSIEKLLRYADRLHLAVNVAVMAKKVAAPKARTNKAGLRRTSQTDTPALAGLR